MKWSKATNEQLEEIAYNDEEAHWIYKVAAVAELLRREYSRGL